ncbi:MAG: hypothetical protein HGA53_10290 [Anaerolineaceae bacterium]|nr:hypothetical protein [Anaerolineaceae bacterium]
MPESLEVSVMLTATADEIYRGWLDSKIHSEFTGSAAEVDPAVGGSFTAWEGYIRGKNLILEPAKRIVQSWRTSDFAESDPDSMIEITFQPGHDGTLLLLKHTEIPDGQAAQYEEGWQDFYFDPMQVYFSLYKI